MSEKPAAPGVLAVPEADLTVNVKEAAYLLQLLGEQPMKQVEGLVGKIRRQLIDQGLAK